VDASYVVISVTSQELLSEIPFGYVVPSPWPDLSRTKAAATTTVAVGQTGSLLAACGLRYLDRFPPVGPG
jgi:hypothetical protein